LGLLKPLERSLEQRARAAARQRRTAQSNVSNQQASLIRIVTEQPYYEKLARQQRIIPKKPPRNYLHTAGVPIEAEARSGSILTILVPPYNYEWTWHWEDQGGHGIPFVDKSKGQFGGHCDNIGSSAAGVGIFFQPLAASAWVSFSPYVKYGYYWLANSHFMNAHTDAFIGTYVVSTGLSGGNVIVHVDTRISIYNATSWWLIQQLDAEDGLVVWPGDVSVEFPAVNQRRYFIWTWCGLNTWGNDGLNPNWSQAYGNLWATTIFASTRQ
jgi:hypothetical protein